MRIFSTFTGIGGFEVGIHNAYLVRHAKRQAEGSSDQHSPDTASEDGAGRQQRPVFVGYSEIDRYASSVYERHFGGVKNYGDITKINAEELPDFDCLVGGFPCQAFSVAGQRRGFDDTRGTLFFDLARILREKQPRFFVFENVKGLLSHDKGKTIATIIATIDELGYDCQWQVLNSKNFGVPQNRERIIIVGHLRGTPRPEVFPILDGYSETSNEVTAKGQLVDLTRREPTNYRERKDGRAGTLDANYYKGLANQERPGVVQLNNPTHSNDRIYGGDGISPTLNTMQGGRRQPMVAMRWQRTEAGKKVRREAQQEGKDYTPFGGIHRELVPVEGKPVGALTAQAIAKDSLIGNDVQIRRLTPLECERLQAFPDNWTQLGDLVYDKNEHRMKNEVISDTQRYKMCGNAVTTNVIQAVFERIFDSVYST